MKKNNYENIIRKKTGLFIDPYFSATKIRWILDNVKESKRLLKSNNLLFGTIDTFLIWKLTKGKKHLTEATNASRTMLYNINTNQWDKNILKKLKISHKILPEVKNSADSFGTLDKKIIWNGVLTGKIKVVINFKKNLGEALKVMNQKKLGIVVLLKNKYVAGIVTDGDLRREIKFLSKKTDLKRFMTNKPLFVNENMPASKALAIMNEKKITSLLVVADKDFNKKNNVKLKGIIHIHFLLRHGLK